jgi:hypothetical protein
MNIYITGVSITTSVGTEPQQVLNNIINQTKAPFINKFITANVPGEIKPYPIYIAPIDNNENYDFVINTLTNLLPQLPENKNKILLHTIIPNNKLFSKVFLKKIITNKKIEFTFSNYEQGVCEQLSNLCSKLENNEYDVIIFGGIDSLINTTTIKKLSEQKRLLTNFSPLGIAPGEAAAFVILQTKNKQSTIIKKISFTKEPYSGQGDTKKLTGLSTAIQNIPPQKIDNILLSLGAEQNDALEWQQVKQTIWPSKKHQTPNIIATYKIFGEIGAATIPLALALSTCVTGNTLICEANEYPIRGAINVQST